MESETQILPTSNNHTVHSMLNDINPNSPQSSNQGNTNSNNNNSNNNNDENMNPNSNIGLNQVNSETKGSNINATNDNNNSGINRSTDDMDVDSKQNYTTEASSNDMNSSKGSIIDNSEFSFSKKPVIPTAHSRHNSRIPMAQNLPKQRDLKPINSDADHHKLYEKYKGKGIVKEKDEDKFDDEELLKYDWDYNEKIRAPRMSIQHLFNTHNITSIQRERKNSSNSNSRKGSLINFNELVQAPQQQQQQQQQHQNPQNNTTNTTNNTQGPLQFNFNSNASTNSTNDYEYQPASFDLSKPTRRYSEIHQNQFNLNIGKTKIFGNMATLNRTNSTEGNNSNNAVSTTPSPKTKPNGMKMVQQQNYQSIDPQQHPPQPLQNQHKQKRSSDPREKIVNGVPVLRQIQDPKKIPDYVPAVLRTSTRSTSLDESVNSMSSEGSSDNNSNTSSQNTTSQLSGQSQPHLSLAPLPEVNEYQQQQQQYNTKQHSSSAAQSPAVSTPNPRHYSISEQEDYFLRTSPIQSRISISSHSNSEGSLQGMNNGNSASSANTNGSIDSTDASLYTMGSSSASSNSLEPSHLHWKPNASRDECYGCHTKFTMLKRKHHCRHCGEIFCFNCSRNRANLNILAKFEVSNYSKESKVCEVCYMKWLAFIAKRRELIARGEIGMNSTSRHNSASGENDEDANGRERVGSTTGVPTDWTWSSF